MLKVMNVDDEPAMLYLTKKILEKEGYNVEDTSSGEECLKKIKEEKPDVILLDVRLPGMDGWEVCKKIKEDNETSSTSIVMFTVRSSKEDIAKSFEYCGAEWHLPRPFEPETLTDILKCVDDDPQKIMEKIEKVVENEERRKKVLKMLNPKIMNYKYEF
ncbi:MAG: PleD family two-component system response regulator [Candidatus Hydrothermarchaeales archaeon]